MRAPIACSMIHVSVTFRNLCLCVGGSEFSEASVSRAVSQPETEKYLREGSGPLADLALTLPVFVVYHLGVVWMDVQNAAAVVTRELKALASSSLVATSGPAL